MQSPTAPADAPAGDTAPLDPGLRILIRGSETSASTVGSGSEVPGQRVFAKTEPEVHVRQAIPRVLLVMGALTLIVADFVLVAWPAAWVIQHRGTTSGTALCACAISICVGAAAGIVGALLWTQRRED